MKTRTWSPPAMLALVAASCGAGAAEFRPTENVTGRTVEGYKEASYDLETADRQIGEVVVWSAGAYPVAHSRGSQTVVDVGFRIDDGGDTPITLDASDVQLESVQTARQTLADVPASGPPGSITVGPRSSREIGLTFALPPGIAPSDVRAFRVRWTTAAGSERYTEFTPFVQQREHTAYIPVDGYYYPYYPYAFYDPFWGPRVHVNLVAPYPRRVIVHGRG